MSRPKCLRCGAGAEWIEGKVPDEPEREAHTLHGPWLEANVNHKKNMIKRYCDTCGNEMTDRNTPHLGTHGGRLQATIKRLDTKLTVEVIQSTNAGVNVGDICKHCILDALYELDDRPQASNGPSSATGREQP